MKPSPAIPADATDSALQFLALQHKTILWMRDAIEEREVPPTIAGGAWSELSWIISHIEQCYNVVVEFPAARLREQLGKNFDRIEVLLLILLMNAGEAYAPWGFGKGQVEAPLARARTARVVVDVKKQDSTWFVMTVKDFGCGIELDRLDQIKRGNALNGDGSPCGGLLLAKHIIKLLDGRIEVQKGDAGRGCIVACSIPVGATRLN